MCLHFKFISLQNTFIFVNNDSIVQHTKSTIRWISLFNVLKCSHLDIASILHDELTWKDFRMVPEIVSTLVQNQHEPLCSPLQRYNNIYGAR